MALAATPGHEAGHAPVHVVHDQLRIKRAGLWLFFFSETLLFGLLLTARFFLTGIEREHLDQQLGLLITCVLLLSSMTAYIGETAVEKGNNRLGHWMIFATILLGVGFAVGVGFEWSIAHFSQHDAFGTSFFSMTGMHAFHVVSGVGILFLVWLQLVRGKFTPDDHWPVSGGVMYWHFVDVVWVFFYPALYLVQ
jgi:cytochrome c oxidase subunit 3